MEALVQQVHRVHQDSTETQVQQDHKDLQVLLVDHKVTQVLQGLKDLQV
jgi:hypothetical protein